MKRILAWMIVLMLMCGLGWAYAEETAEGAAYNPDQIAETLRGLGIQIPDETLAQAKAWMEEYMAYLQSRDLIVSAPDKMFAAYLLSAVGQGVYDYDTCVWTPTSADVYAFDAEVYDIENMYRLFLQGVAAIVPGFSCDDIQETLEEGWSLKNLLIGGGLRAEGVKTVSFRLNGKTYRKDLNYYHDWFDENAVQWINDVLEAEEFSGRLYSLDDAGQGLILIYGGPEKAEAVRRVLDQ